jgi:DNA ligase-1
LWGGRGTFQQAVSIAKAQSSDQRWKELTFQIFDAPSINKSFEERMKVIREDLRGNKPPYARVRI